MDPQTIEEGPTKKELVKDCLKSWNKLVRNLVMAEKHWKDYVETRLGDELSLEEFDLEAQKVLYLMNPTGDFGLILEDIATHPDVSLFLKTLIIEV